MPDRFPDQHDLTMPNSTPNIIYILADDMGYGDMGCNNPDSKIPTPHLDMLAGEGMRFTDAHAPSSVCTPSRYALLTGRYCWRTPLKNSVLWPYDPPLIEPGRLTVAEMLRGQGYRTACIGKWHLGWEWATTDGQLAHEGTAVGRLDRELREERERHVDFSAPMRGGRLIAGSTPISAWTCRISRPIRGSSRTASPGSRPYPSPTACSDGPAPQNPAGPSRR